MQHITWKYVALACVATGVAAAAVAQATQRSEAAFPTGDRASSIVLLARTGPAEIRAGETFDYTLEITNLTNGTIKNLVLAETPPAGFAVASINPPPQRSESGASVWEWATFGPRETKTLTFRGSAGSEGTLEGCATISLSGSACGPLRVVQPALVLQKTAPAEVIQCDPIPMVLTVRNPGSGIARNVTINDTLPDGWRTSDGRTTVTIPVGDLGPGQQREVRLEARSDATGSFTNNATATEDGGLSANASATTVVTKPELSVSKQGPAMRFIGRPAEFTVTVTNTGDAPARDTILEDAVPNLTQFVSADNGGALSGGHVRWNLGTLAPGESRTVSMRVTCVGMGTVRNVATARAYCAEAQGEVSMEVKGIPAILLEVIDINDPVEVGANETYEIVVVNQGSATDSNIRITCTLPPEEELVSAGGATSAQADGKRIVFAPLPSLAPKARAKFTVVVKAVGANDVRFKVSMTSDQIKRPVEETESTNLYE